MATVRDHVTATDLARNLATLIDRVRVSGKRIAITRGNREVAQLVPPRNEGASAAELLELLKSNSLTETERSSLADDLQTIRKNASLPPSPWES
ncbi:MAG: type II toxin-antitoxin system prevent-host-death family antitoxin [Sedimenticola sp.]